MTTTLVPADRPSDETAVAAVEAHAKAAIQARHIMAVERPRDLDQTRAELMRECDRPGFADSALYNKPIGKGVTGLSIRFAEAAIKAMRNVYVESPAIYDSAKLRIIRVTVTDLESNVTYSKDVTVRKEVERKKLRRGQVPIAERVNSFGDTIFIVEASDDDILNKEGALISKAMRTQALRLVPGWLQEECEERVKATMKDRDAKDPDAAKRRLVDAFSELGVKPQHLKDYLDHDLDECSPAELVELRSLWQTINDGEATWREAMDFKSGGEVEEEGTKSDKVKDKLKKKAAGKKAGKKRQPKPRTPEAADQEPPSDPNPDDGMGGEEPEEPADPDGEVMDDLKFEERCAAAMNSEDLKLLNEEVHKRLLAEQITNEQQMEMMSMLHARSLEIAQGK